MEQKNWTVGDELRVRSFRDANGQLVKPLEGRFFVYRLSGVHEITKDGSVTFRVWPPNNITQVSYKFETRAATLARVGECRDNDCCESCD